MFGTLWFALLAIANRTSVELKGKIVEISSIYTSSLDIWKNKKGKKSIKCTSYVSRDKSNDIHIQTFYFF